MGSIGNEVHCSVGVVGEFGIATAEMRNDSTSVSVPGQYRDADGEPRRGKPTPAMTFGHSNDHRPDLKQLVWILTVSAAHLVALVRAGATFRRGKLVERPTTGVEEVMVT